MKLAFVFGSLNCTAVGAEAVEEPWDGSFRRQRSMPARPIYSNQVNFVSYVATAAVIATLAMKIDFSLF
jgi:hypothetical protein